MVPYIKLPATETLQTLNLHPHALCFTATAVHGYRVNVYRVATMGLWFSVLRGYQDQLQVCMGTTGGMACIITAGSSRRRAMCMHVY